MMPKFLLLLLFSLPSTGGAPTTEDQRESGTRPASGPSAPAETASTQPADPKPKVAKNAKSTKAKQPRRSRRRRGRCRATAPANYRKMVRNWQKVPRIPKPRFRSGYRDLVLYSVNLRERIRVFPFRPEGSLDPDALAELEALFRDKDTENSHAIHPRLVKLLYRLADQLDARQLTIISGFREAAEPGGGGHHADGSAVDLMVPGIPLPRVAKVLRRYGHVGVGYYPTAGFVHLDVREGRSYFWADRSGPGYGSCLHQIMPQSAITFDRRWRPEHDEPQQHRNKQGELLGAPPESTAPPTAPSSPTRPSTAIGPPSAGLER